MAENDLQKTNKEMEEKNLGLKNVNLKEHYTQQFMIALELANQKIQSNAEALKKKNENISSSHGSLSSSQLPLTKSSSDFGKPPPSPPPTPITGFLRSIFAEETSNNIFEEPGEFEFGLGANPLRDLDDDDVALLDRLNESSNQDLGLGFQNINCNNIERTDSLQTATPFLQHGSFQELSQLPVTAASDLNQNRDVKNDPLLGLQETWNDDLGFLGNIFAEESGQGSTASGSITKPASHSQPPEFKSLTLLRLLR